MAIAVLKLNDIHLINVDRLSKVKQCLMSRVQLRMGTVGSARGPFKKDCDIVSTQKKF